MEIVCMYIVLYTYKHMCAIKNGDYLREERHQWKEKPLLRNEWKLTPLGVEESFFEDVSSEGFQMH